jgi:hypothetical protein
LNALRGTKVVRGVALRLFGSVAHAALVLLAISAGACNGILGDVEIERAALTVDPSAPDGAPVSGPTGGAGGSSMEPSSDGECEVGAIQCVGSALSLCTAAGRWVPSDICGSPALCNTDPPGCEPPECGLDQLSCDGARLRACNPTRDGWLALDSCASAAHCNPTSRQCLAAPCAAGELRCNQGDLQRCDDDELDWALLDSCATQAVCEQALAGGGNACSPPACEAGARRCVEGSLQRCNDGRTDFELLANCANTTLCTLSLDNGSAACEPPLCATGEHRCREATLTVCNPVSGSCRAPGCELGERRCNGSQIETCNLDRTAFEVAGALSCANGSVCVDGSNGTAACELLACDVGERRCEGPRLEECNTARLGFGLLETCGSAALCVQARRGESFECAAPACGVGEAECRGRNLAVCNSDLTGFDVVSCGVLGCNDAGGSASCNTLGELL